MKLAIVSDQSGVIQAVAVCQVTFTGDRFASGEVELTAENTSTHPHTEPLHCHIIKAPSHLHERRGHELAQGLDELRTSMRVKLDGRSARLVAGEADKAE